MKPEISVMTLSNRYGGIDIMWANLMRQTVENWEWVFIDALYDYRKDEVAKYTNNDPRVKHIKQGEKVEGAYTHLAHADNEGFRACEGELIILVQDYIWIPHNSLEKFWFHHKNMNGKALITGVGHQYEKPSAEDIADSKGKITVFDEPYKGKPRNLCWQDPRMRTDFGSFYGCQPADIEFNYCAIPRKAVADLGGMDEEFDMHGFAWDNVSMAVKAQMLGYECMIDQTNECMGFDHDGWWPNPLKVNRISPAEYHFKTIKEITEGTRPIKLPYVTYPDL